MVRRELVDAHFVELRCSRAMVGALYEVATEAATCSKATNCTQGSRRLVQGE